MKEGRSLDKAEANGGYIWIEKSFVIEILPHLSGLASRVYLYLVFNSPQGKKADPITRKGLSAATIGKALKRDRRSITKALNGLVRIGAIEKISEAGLSNRYRLLATYEENVTRGGKKTSQGSEENTPPPGKKTSQVDAAKPYETRTGSPSKSILRESKIIKERRSGLRPVQPPQGCGPRKV